MKQIVRISFLLVAAAALTLSCSKDMGSPVPQDQENQVIMTVTIPNDLTKVSFTKDSDVDGAVKVAWEGTDKIRVIDHNDANNHQQFSIQAGYTDHSASFAGTEVTAASYDILYPGTMESVAEAEAVQYGVQTQTGDASTAHLAYMALLSGVDTYEDVDFSEAWATAHGGTFKQSGILRLRIQLPDAINSSKIASLTVNAPSALFYKSNACIAGEKVSSVKLNFSGEGATPVEGVVTGFIMLPWENVSVAANTQLFVIVETAAHAFYTKSFTPSTTETKTFAMGRVNAVKLNNTGFGAASPTFAGGSGTTADPWLIANATHMGNIASNLSTSEKKYFKLIDDITLGDTWTSLNPTPFTRQIDFDGNGRTINHLRNPMFDDLNGSVYNLTIDDAVVSSTNTVGILANTVKTAASQVSGVTLSDCSLNFSPSATGSFVGGLVGEVSTGSSFDDCHLNNVDIDLKVAKESYLGGAFGYVHHADATIGHTLKCTVDNNSSVKSGNYAAGFISKFDGGRVEKAEVACDVSGSATVGGLIAHMTSGTLSGITVSGKVSGTQRVGGLIGNNAGGTIENSCYIDNTVSGTSYRVGGLIGWASGTNDLEVSNCYTRGSISAPQQLSGMLGGAEGSGKIEITNCYTDSSLSDGSYRGALVARTWNTATTVSGFIAWVTGIGISGSGAVPGTAGTDYYIGQDGTILSHAQTFGWNFTTIWNEVNPPTLK